MEMDKMKRNAGTLELLLNITEKLMWLGGLLIAAAYICFFYYTFVSPFSFRWRAIYGTPTYPDGYDGKP